MISIGKIYHKLGKVGQSSTSLVLPKDWADGLKKILQTDDIMLSIFGKEFLVLEVKGLPIKDKETRELLRKNKKHFFVNEKD